MLLFIFNFLPLPLSSSSLLSEKSPVSVSWCGLLFCPLLYILSTVANLSLLAVLRKLRRANFKWRGTLPWYVAPFLYFSLPCLSPPLMLLWKATCCRTSQPSMRVRVCWGGNLYTLQRHSSQLVICLGLFRIRTCQHWVVSCQIDNVEGWEPRKVCWKMVQVTARRQHVPKYCLGGAHPDESSRWDLVAAVFFFLMKCFHGNNSFCAW